MKTNLVILIFILLSTPLASPAWAARTLCLGPENAKHFAIYFHGMDGREPSWQELQVRETLETVARKLSIRIAVPRATMPCPTAPQGVCWGWYFTPDEIANALPGALDERKACFPAKVPFGMIGFSNGGYLLSRWYQRCLYPKMRVRPDWLIATGAANGIHTPEDAADLGLAKCSKIVFVTGSQDTGNGDVGGDFLKELLSRGADAGQIRFSGGHEVNGPAMERALRRVLR